MKRWFETWWPSVSSGAMSLTLFLDHAYFTSLLWATMFVLLLGKPLLSQLVGPAPPEPGKRYHMPRRRPRIVRDDDVGDDIENTYPVPDEAFERVKAALERRINESNNGKDKPE